MSEFREALQRVVDEMKDPVSFACSECTPAFIEWRRQNGTKQCAYHTAKALLARGEPAAAEKAREWRPIDSAPRDRTRIIGVWVNSEGKLVPGEDYGICRFFDGDWHNAEYPYERWAAPTHWMPLPSPPAAIDGGAKA